MTEPAIAAVVTVDTVDVVTVEIINNPLISGHYTLKNKNKSSFCGACFSRELLKFFGVTEIYISH